MTANPSAKPMPKVVSFQDTLPQPRRYRPQADRILSGDPAQVAINLFRSADGRFNSGIWEAQPGKWRVVFTESEFCICSRALSWSPATMALSARSEQVTPSCRPPVLPALGKSSNPRKSSTHTMSD